MTSKKKYDIQVNENFIRTMLLNKIKEATSDKAREELTDILIGIIQDSDRMEILVDNFLGMITQKWQVGDRVFCDSSVTRHRRSDGKIVLDQRKNAGCVGWAEIREFNPYAKNDNYKISYIVMLGDGTMEQRDRWFSSYWLSLKDPDGKLEKGGKS